VVDKLLNYETFRSIASPVESAGSARHAMTILSGRSDRAPGLQQCM
jgi:hypothetical protein